MKLVDRPNVVLGNAVVSPLRKRTSRASTCCFALAAALTLLVGSGSAQAQESDRQGPDTFGLSFEALGALPIDGQNDDRFGTGIGAAVHGEYNINSLLGIHFGLLGLTFDAASGDMSGTAGTEWLDVHLGARLHWGVWAGKVKDDGWVDLHANLGTSGGIQRGGMDLGLGYEFAMGDGRRIGPLLRYQFGTDPLNQHAQLLTVGLSVTLAGGDRVKIIREKDSDDDGILDSRDECPEEPAGKHPDPERLGCPLDDTDEDGIYDDEDECVEVPAGDRPDMKRPGCPLEDTDGDGYYDDEDECIDERPGPLPHPDKVGCPANDRDGDLVADDDDACPDEPGAPSRDPEMNGCPGLVRIIDGEIRIMEPVFFNSNSTAVQRKSNKVLQAVADAVDILGIKVMRIEGHADDRGDESYNMTLSENRANAVVRWLEEHDVGARLIPVGYGEARPLEDNDSSWGRSQNRRVVFRILDAEYQPAGSSSVDAGDEENDSDEDSDEEGDSFDDDEDDDDEGGSFDDDDDEDDDDEGGSFDDDDDDDDDDGGSFED